MDKICALVPMVERSTVESVLKQSEEDWIKCCAFFGVKAEAKSEPVARGVEVKVLNTLDDEHKRWFYINGFLHLPQLVRREVVDRARAFINGCLEDGLDKPDFHYSTNNRTQVGGWLQC